MLKVFKPHAAKATSKRRQLVAIATATAGFLSLGLGAHAQGYYYINGAPASPEQAQFMASNGFPFGNYWWDQASGNWGVVGNPQPLGNIRPNGATARRVSPISPSGPVIDPSGGCEGGSCVNFGPD